MSVGPVAQLESLMPADRGRPGVGGRARSAEFAGRLVSAGGWGQAPALH